MLLSTHTRNGLGRHIVLLALRQAKARRRSPYYDRFAEDILQHFLPWSQC